MNCFLEFQDVLRCNEAHNFRPRGIHNQDADTGPWTVDKCTSTMTHKASSSIFIKLSHLAENHDTNSGCAAKKQNSPWGICRNKYSWCKHQEIFNSKSKSVKFNTRFAVQVLHSTTPEGNEERSSAGGTVGDDVQILRKRLKVSPYNRSRSSTNVDCADACSDTHPLTEISEWGTMLSEHCLRKKLEQGYPYQPLPKLAGWQCRCQQLKLICCWTEPALLLYALIQWIIDHISEVLFLRAKR